MGPHELEKMARLEEQYWWFAGRRFIVKSLIKNFWKPSTKTPIILDLGCGTGGSFCLLKEFGTVVGLDASQFALSYAHQRGMKPLVLADGQKLPFTDNCFDLVAILDVLEHLDDDEMALREIWRILKVKGALVFTVPAFMSLWSVHDIALQHRRRYLPYNLTVKFYRANFRILKMSFAISGLLPFVFIFRKVQNWLMRNKKPETALIELPNLPNKLLINLLQFEARLLPHVGLPFGVSLVGIAEKP